MIFLGQFALDLQAIASELEGDEVREVKGKGLLLSLRKDFEEVEGRKVALSGPVLRLDGKDAWAYFIMPL